MSAYTTALGAFQKATKECAMIDLGCAFTDVDAYDCNAQADDPIKAMKTTCDANRDGSVTTNKNDESTNMSAAVTAVATAWDVKTGKNADNVVALANLATINSSIDTQEALNVGTLTTNISTATNNETTAQTNYDTVDG